MATSTEPKPRGPSPGALSAVSQRVSPLEQSRGHAEERKWTVTGGRPRHLEPLSRSSKGGFLSKIFTCLLL